MGEGDWICWIRGGEALTEVLLCRLLLPCALQVKFKSRKNAELLNGSLYLHIESLWNASLPLLDKGTYKPTLETVIEGCLAALPWWSASS